MVFGGCRSFLLLVTTLQSPAVEGKVQCHDNRRGFWVA